VSRRGRRLAAIFAGVVILLFAGRWTSGVLADRWWAAEVSPSAVDFLTDWHLLHGLLSLAGIVIAGSWFIGHLLAVYTGDPPAAASIPAIRLADLQLPAELPLRVPSELVRQRPDIRANEALLHKASANVGVATADLYPKLTISGGFSTSQLRVSDLFGNGINIWNIGANLLQPLFHGGELQARKRAAIAAFDQAAAAYRLSVLQGLQNVADVLRSLEADEAAFTARSEQAARAEEAYQITVGRFNAGGVSQLDLIDAERQRLQAESDRLQAQAGRYSDAAALFQALGGGWAAAPATAVR